MIIFGTKTLENKYSFLADRGHSKNRFQYRLQDFGYVPKVFILMLINCISNLNFDYKPGLSKLLLFKS